MIKTSYSRKHFLEIMGLLVAGSAIPSTLQGYNKLGKLKVSLVGTGIRGITYWGRRLVEHYPDQLRFVGLCDINPGRVTFAKEYIGADCKTYTDFSRMLRETTPDIVIVATEDANHHEFIITALENGCDVITEKPLTTDAHKCQAILDAEQKSGRNLIVAFNYRWSPYMTKIKELLLDGHIGEITSVDFNWYLNVHHGASYFRRWHGIMNRSGSLWIHKATHHFDLLNWWLDADPEEVFAYGTLDHYGANGPFSGENCRTCTHKHHCKYHWDITSDNLLTNLYVKHEQHDGYIRDNCLYREEIDIYDKMSAQIKYMNNVVVNYSLTTYSPFEGWRIAFNGHKGRIEAWLDIPWMKNEMLDQSNIHAMEMSQSEYDDKSIEPVILFKNWENFETINVLTERGGHGGGDDRLQDRIFIDPNAHDPYKLFAGVRDGIMSVLIGVAARESIQTRQPVKIESLTNIKPSTNRS